ncbi:MAG: TerB family tellurite resistance protein [Pseudomonadota bacterium]|nr:TerB family tellurite resistance protein [Pseudomonadota bacterium]
MINKIKELITKFGNKEKIEEESVLSQLNNACAALLVEIAFADKDFDETEKASLKLTLMETYAIEEADIDEIIKDAENTIAESTSLYGYTRIVNDEFEYDDKLSLLKNLWKVAYADGNLDKYEEHLLRKISDLIHISHSDYINIKLEVRGD